MPDGKPRKDEELSLVDLRIYIRHTGIDVRVYVTSCLDIGDARESDRHAGSERRESSRGLQVMAKSAVDLKEPSSLACVVR